ncbi:protein FLX-like 4 [Mercurialis annua]|uniref:protein FLX-like 4 n=1 Tax=Mercurialis annua TaxID=3986 RepID=UPI002160ABD9|nr:protein FLX-like 4 [Mercurialis annua]XP_050219072.1 protein FLX-like 4 [Mercurialis annua]XP_050219073.1 protein FLX-like 4 [Mercurialis annua]XP_050219074.1 protein FLX-like 4 [Mercurialis annua]
MAGRRHIPSERSIRQGQYSLSQRQLDRLPPPDFFDNKIAAQAGEIEQLTGDNRRLAAAHLALRQDHADAQQEVEELKAHIRSIQTESDIQMRVLLDKIAKLESEIRLGENVKKELRQAHMEAQSLVKAGQELTRQIQQASQELEKYRGESKSLPDLQAELDSLRLEYKRVRVMFESEKGLNIEKVEHLQAMEQNLIGMAREMEKLYAEVLIAEKKAHAKKYAGGGYATPDFPDQHSLPGSAANVEAYGMPLVQTSNGPTIDGTILYSSGNDAAVIGGIDGAVFPSDDGVATWEGTS